MFEVHYTAEKSIKEWAKAFYYIAIALPILGILTFLILLGVDEDLWGVGLIVLGGSLLSAASLIFSAQMVWGYAEIIGNTKRLRADTKVVIEEKNETLPEL